MCHLILLSFLLCLRTTNQRAKKERKKFVWREVCAALKKKKRTSLCVFLRKGVNAYSILLEKLEQKFLSKSQFPLSFSFSLASFSPFYSHKMITAKHQRSIFKRPSRYKVLFICLIFLLPRVSMAIDSWRRMQNNARYL